MPAFSADPLPCLSEACVPPAIIGVAALTTTAMQGADAAALAAMIGRLDADPVARLYDTSIAYQLGFRRAEGLGLQDEASLHPRCFVFGETVRAAPAYGCLRSWHLVC